MQKEKENYILAQGERNGLPYFLGVKEKFYEFEKKHDYPWLMQIRMQVNSDEKGSISAEEDNTLNQLEDFLHKKIKKASQGLFIARLTWNGSRTLFYYLADPETISNELDDIISQGQYTREFEYKIEEDREWKKMSDIIPNIEEL